MSTFVAFPNVKPSSRTFSPGDYPQTVFEAQNGAKTILRYGSKRVNATLTLGFSNVSDGAAALIIQNYDDVNSTWKWVKFTDDNGALGIDDAGTGDLFKKEIRGNNNDGQTRKGMRWRYASAPKITSVKPGVSNVSCTFVACMDGT